MRKPDPVELALDRLSAIRAEAGPAAAGQLKAFLKNRVNLVVAKAAAVAGRLRTAELVPDLLAAFERLMANPQKLDKGCAATTAIAEALYAMDCLDPDVYLRGIRHVQMEPSFGAPVDAAVRLRAQCALGLVRTRHPEAAAEVLQLLVDREPLARIGAVRALATLSSDAGPLLLRFKALIGDSEAEVLGECFAGLLESSPEPSLRFVARYLDDPDPAVCEAAALALGAAHCPASLGILQEKWRRTTGPLRGILLLAMATARHHGGPEFLLSLLESESAYTAVEVIAALRIYRDDERVRTAVEEIVRRRGEREIGDAFRAAFGI